MNVVFLCFSSIKLELFLDYSEDKAKQKGRRNWFFELQCLVLSNQFKQVYLLKTYHAWVHTLQHFWQQDRTALVLQSKQLNKMVLSSKVYKEAFCLLVAGLWELKHTELKMQVFQQRKKEKEINTVYIVSSQTVKLNLSIFMK